MATPQLSDEVLRATLQALHDNGNNQVHAAEALGMSRATLQGRIRQAKVRGITVLRSLRSEVHVAPAPQGDCRTAEELIEQKKTLMTRALAREKWAELIQCTIKDNKPIATLIIGDPHVDDDYCDIGRLEADLATVAKTRGMYAAHVGDLINNWAGRLEKLYAHQRTRFDEAIVLVDWMFKAAPTLVAINGNHDCWNKGADIIKWVSRAAIHESHGARLRLNWPGGEHMTVNIRHDFKGRSMYSATHGHRRELREGHRDDLLVAGHIHQDEASVTPTVDGVHHLYRVSGYKVIDEYAKEHDFKRLVLGPSVCTILNPWAKMPADRIKPFWDVEEGADYLTFLRSRR